MTCSIHEKTRVGLGNKYSLPPPLSRTPTASGGVAAPWFARPLLPPPRPSPEATASTTSAGGGVPGAGGAEDIEASFYEDDHVILPTASVAATSFRNRQDIAMFNLRYVHVDNTGLRVQLVLPLPAQCCLG